MAFTGPSVKNLGADFAIETGRAARTHWSEVIGRFSDANIFQTWSYEAVRSGPENVTHLQVKRGGRVVAAAQVRMIRIPCLGQKVAYVRWGPLWQLRGEEPEAEVFRQVVRALHREYVARRGMVIRLVPHLGEVEGEIYRTVLREEGYVEQHRRPRYRTIIMDIRPPLEELNRGLHQKWRNCLNVARKRNLEVVEGEHDEMFEEFESIYQEMLDRKQFSSDVEPAQFRQIQQDLPLSEKMRVVLCRTEGQVCAGAICSALGATGLYLLGATSNSGMKSNGSYLAQWKVIEWLKLQGCSGYNLHGINPVQNEGTYRFKSRLAGASGRDLCFLGQFDAYPSRTVQWLVANAERMRAALKGARELARAPRSLRRGEPKSMDAA